MIGGVFTKDFAARGYVVREAGPVYYTTDMDKTVNWFHDVLGWYYEIDERNADGQGQYGCVYDLPCEIERLHVAPFTGIHLFYGAPLGGCIAFLKVTGIESLYNYVMKSGYEQITHVEIQPWGSKMCTITTPDGYTLQFFE